MHICIVGDSWGLGEWDSTKPPYKYENTHKGLQFYLEEKGHIVTNLSRAGASNFEAYTQLENSSYQNFDHIIWFKSDPLRSVFSFTKEFSKHPNFDKLLELQTKDNDNQYKLFNQLGKKIICIGGAGKLDLKIIVKYNNLIPFIPALTEHFIKEYKHPKIWTSACWIDKISLKNGKHTIDMLNSMQEQKHLLKNEKIYFWPDGEHLNRHGHKVLCDLLVKEYNF